MKAKRRLLQSTGRGPGLRARLAAALLAAGFLGAMPQVVAALDNGPTIAIGSTTDAATGDGRILSDVRITEASFTLTIDKLTIKGLKQSDSGFLASEITIDKLVFAAGGAGGSVVEIPQATLRNIAGPALGATSFSTQAAPGSLPAVATLLLAAKADTIAIPQLIVRAPSPAASTAATYTNLAVNGLDAGRVARIAFDALDSGASGGRHMTVGKSRISDLDFGAYAAWLDDAIATAAPPQMKPVYSSFELNDLTFADAGSDGTINRISGSDFKLAPPGMKPSDLAGLLGHMEADGNYAQTHPADVVRLVRTLLASFSLGSLRIDGMVINDQQDAPVGIGLIRAEAISGSGIGEMRFGDVSGTTRDEKAPFTLGSMALRDFRVTDLDPMLDMLAAGGKIADLREEQYPKVRMSGFALADFSADVPDKGQVRVGGFTVDTPDWAGLLPSTMAVHLAGLSSPLANIDDPQSRATAEKLGLKVIGINADVNLAWKQADQTLTFGPTSLDIDQFGRFEIDGTIGNVPTSMFVSPGTSILALFDLDFRGASLHAEDGGGLSRMIALTAQEQKISVEQLALGSTVLAQSELGALLGAVNAKKIAEAIQAFILKPDAVTITVKTSKPLPIAPLLGGAEALSDSDREAIRNNVTIDTKPE